MAHATNNPYVYDCGTCSKPVHIVGEGWAHNDRYTACVIVSVVEGAPVSVKVTADNVALVA